MNDATSTWIGLKLVSDRYLVTEKLGEGGMGAVYRATDRRLGTDVVIKVPHVTILHEPEFAQRFTREIQSLVKLSHPHIVKVQDVGQHAKIPFAVMQFLAGGSLDDRRKEDGQQRLQRVEAATLEDWLADVAHALDFVHKQGYLHRDIKPANILFDEHGHVFLSDFGVAKVISDAASRSRNQSLTGTGMVLGTAHYMAPEMILGKAVDGRADQYALAVVVYELLAGRRPFEGPTSSAVWVTASTQPAPRLQEFCPDVSPSLAEAIHRSLAKEPERRYGSCTAFAEEALAAVRQGKQNTSPEIVRLACPACGSLLQVGPKYAGRQVACPACSASLEISPDRRRVELAARSVGAAANGAGGSAESLSVSGTNVLTPSPQRAPSKETGCVSQQQIPTPSLPSRAKANSPWAWLKTIPSWAWIAGAAALVPLMLVFSIRFPSIWIGLGLLVDILVLVFLTFIRAWAWFTGNSSWAWLKTIPSWAWTIGWGVLIPVVLLRLAMIPQVPEVAERPMKALPQKSRSPDKKTHEKSNEDSPSPLDSLPRMQQLGGESPVPQASKSPLAIAPFDVQQARAHQDAWAKDLGAPVEMTNSIGMKLALIPAGEFRMGSPNEEKGHQNNETQHRVRITKPFYLGIYAVTQGEYKRLMNTNPSYVSPSGYGKDKLAGQDPDRFPVESVSWDEAQEFCRLLCEREARTYRLPTEAEWEYACRAGTTTPFHFGDKLNGQEANCRGTSPYGPTTNGPYLERTCAVGSYAPNGFGLYDMHGNVWQWCADRYDAHYYAVSPADDPKGPDAGQAPDAGAFRVFRGGGWDGPPVDCRSAARFTDGPTDRIPDVGFRVVCEW